MKHHDLSEAIDDGDIEKLRQLFEPSDLEGDSYYEGSLLNYAAASGAVEIVKFLVDNGADIDQVAGRLSKMSPVTVAAKNGNLKIVRYLIEDAGAKIDLSRSSNNPLMRAASRGEIRVVEYFLKAGVDPHLTYRIPSGKLINAFTSAEQQGEAEAVEFLKKIGCRKPVEGKDIPVSEPSQKRMMNHVYGPRQPQTQGYQKYQQIIQYMEERFGVADQDGMQEHVTVIEGMSVAINVIQPNEQHPFWVLFTNGMSDLPMKVPDGQDSWQYAELVMYLPPDWIHPREAGSNPSWLWPVRCLRSMAYQPHLAGSWLGMPAAIVSGNEPLGPNTEQSCMLLMPDLSGLSPPLQTEEQLVHFYTMVPIYAEERDIEIKNGRNDFLDRFYNAEVPLFVDVNRPNFGLT